MYFECIGMVPSNTSCNEEDSPKQGLRPLLGIALVLYAVVVRRIAMQECRFGQAKLLAKDGKASSSVSNNPTASVGLSPMGICGRWYALETNDLD